MIVYIGHGANYDEMELLKKYCEFIHYKGPIIIEYNEYGKPYIKGNPFYFNKSHSYDYTLLACSQQEIGIDIEKHREIKKHALKRLYTKDEQEEVKDDVNKFYDLWVRKESYVKLKGCALTECVQNTPNCLFYPISIDENYSCAVASYNEIETIKLVDCL